MYDRHIGLWVGCSLLVRALLDLMGFSTCPPSGDTTGQQYFLGLALLMAEPESPERLAVTRGASV